MYNILSLYETFTTTKIHNYQILRTYFYLHRIQYILKRYINLMTKLKISAISYNFLYVTCKFCY